MSPDDEAVAVPYIAQLRSHPGGNARRVADVSFAMRMWGAVLLVALGGCAASGDPATPAQSTSGAVDCGTFVLQQGERPPTTALECLIGASQTARPARLKMTRPTVEGDPIHETYESDANGQVRVTRDTRQDNYGAQEVTTEVCTGIAVDRGRLTFENCEQ